MVLWLDPATACKSYVDLGLLPLLYNVHTVPRQERMEILVGRAWNIQLVQYIEAVLTLR